MLNFAFHNAMDGFQFEPVWELGEGRLDEEPYFNLAVVFFHLIEDNEINLIYRGIVGYVDGRLAVIYGFGFDRQENLARQRHGG